MIGRMGKLKQLWQELNPKDRKLVLGTGIACTLVLVVSLAVLFLYTRTHTPETELPPLDTISQDSLAAKPEGLEDSSLTSLPEAILSPSTSGEEILTGLDSFDTQAHRELSRIYAEKADYQGSLTHAHRIAHWLEEDLEFQGHLGQTYLKAGSPQEAIPYLRKAIQLGGETAELSADLALALFRGLHPDSGLISIRNALQKHPNHPLLRTHEAAMFGESKDRNSQGETLFRKLAQDFPHFPEARYQFGRFLMNQGNYASAQRELESALRLEPLDPRYHARMGMAQFYLGQDHKAQASYKTALAMNPRDYNTWYNLGELYLSQANESETPSRFALKTREALEAYLASLALRADHADAHYRVGTILNTNRSHREAIRHLEQALRKDPQSVRVLVQLAAAWEALGSPSKAWDFVQKAYEIDPFHQLVVAQYRRLKQSSAPLPPS